MGQGEQGGASASIPLRGPVWPVWGQDQMSPLFTLLVGMTACPSSVCRFGSQSPLLCREPELMESDFT